MTIKVKVKRNKTKSSKRKQQELTRLGGALRTLGGLGGRALGSMVGFGSEGAGIGTGLGAALSRWLGSGDYAVTSNSIVQRAESSGTIPSMHKEGQTVTIRHKEYLGEIRGKQTFTVRNAFPINPGVSATFPWLSRIASCFQEYRIKGMVYHYVPTSGNAISSTNAALGSVLMQTSYRSNDSAPSSKVEMMNEYWSSESRPSEAFCHPVECNPKENPFNVQYVRSLSIPANDSVLLYDLGVTYVAVTGQQANDTVLGDLWVTYEVELKKPILESNVTDQYPGAGMQIVDDGGSITGATLFNGEQERTGSLVITASGNTITFPPGATGDWSIAINTEANTTFTACNFTTGVTTSDCTLTNYTKSAGIVRTTLGGSSPTLTRFFYECAVRIVEPNVQATVTIPTGTLTGAALNTNILVLPVAN